MLAVVDDLFNIRSGKKSSESQVNQEKERNNLINFRLLELLLTLNYFPYFSKKKKKAKVMNIYKI